MKNVLLSYKENFLLEDKIFLIKRGKVIVKNILENGLIVPENILNEGELICDIFTLLPNENPLNVKVKIEALEDGTILEEYKVDNSKIRANFFLSKLLSSIAKRALVNLFFHIYDSKGYILAILKFYFSDKKYSCCKNIHFENFNLSKSQFYLVLSQLKKEGFIYEIENRLILDKSKVDEYLRVFTG